MNELRKAAEMALEFVEFVWRDVSLNEYAEEKRSHIEKILEDALAQPESEPVAWLPSAEWTACIKLPVTVHVRAQCPGETHISTREGITPVKPDDLIMRGVSGEEYPIGREIFERTYRMGDAPPQRKPLTEGQIFDLVRSVSIEGTLMYVDLCRAIEKAHGIGGEHEY